MNTMCLCVNLRFLLLMHDLGLCLCWSLHYKKGNIHWCAIDFLKNKTKLMTFLLDGLLSYTTMLTCNTYVQLIGCTWPRIVITVSGQTVSSTLYTKHNGIQEDFKMIISKINTRYKYNFSTNTTGSALL